MHRYKDLDFWRRSKEISVDIYKVTNKFPSSEKFGMINQMRRAAVSIASNIAEGSSRSSDKDFRRFLEISTGSAYELQTQLMISRELNYLGDKEFNGVMGQLEIVVKQISSFKIKCLRIK